MGEIVLAAKVTHVPTLQMSEQEGPIKGKRQPAIDGHLEIARRAKALGADTVVVCDTHWLVNAGFHINANNRFKGLLTSSEFPQFIRDLPYDHPGNPELGDAIAEKATELGVYTLSHHLDSLDLEYGTLVPMHFMSREHDMKVVSVAAFCTVHDHDESRVIGEAIRAAVDASDSKVPAARLRLALPQDLVEQGICAQQRDIHHLVRVQPPSRSDGSGHVEARRSRHLPENPWRLCASLLGRRFDARHGHALWCARLGQIHQAMRNRNRLLPELRHRPGQCDLPRPLTGATPRRDKENADTLTRSLPALQHRSPVPCGTRGDRSGEKAAPSMSTRLACR